MNEIRSSAPLRHIIAESTTQLRQQPTRLFPDGATAYVPGASAIYQLIKGLGTTFDDLTGRVLVPGDQTTNRWVQQEQAGASPWAAIEFVEEAVVTTPNSQSAWRALGVNGGSYALSYGDAAMFVVDPSSSLLTYHGVARQMTIRLNTTLRNSSGGALELHAVVSHNNDVPADNTSEQRSFGEQGTTVPDGGAGYISTIRAVPLANTDTLRIMYRNMTSGAAFTVDFANLTISPF